MEKRQLEQMGCTGETLEKALGLCRKAKVATGPGSGRELGELSTALAPICALFASEDLHNEEVSVAAAQEASCLNKKNFSRALQILRAALDHEEESKKATSYGTLLEKYVSHPLARKQLETFCKQAEAQLKQLGSKANFKSNDSICTIVYWVCAAAKIKELPEVQDYSAAHKVGAKKISTECPQYTKRLPTLRKQISDEVQIPTPARTPSPTKRTLIPTPTPRRSARQPQRELLTKESVKKPAATSETTPQPSSRASRSQAEVDDDDDDAMAFPETPTKRRRLDTTPSPSSAKRLFPTNNVGSSSRLTLNDSPQPPQTPRKAKATPARGSPLKRTIIPEPEDRDMIDLRDEVRQEPSDSDDDEEPQSRLFRRFRPIYREHKMWGKTDRRIQHSIKVGEKRKLEFFQKHGNPFHAVPVS